MQSHAAYVIPRQLWHGLTMRISTTITHMRKNSRHAPTYSVINLQNRVSSLRSPLFYVAKRYTLPELRFSQSYC